MTDLRCTVHVLDAAGRCALCGAQLPWCHRALPGDFVGVTVFRDQTQHATGYRIGANNRDSRCDGMKHEGFFQDSLKPKQ